MGGCVGAALAIEGVLGGVRHAQQRVVRAAFPEGDAAPGIEPPDCADETELALAAPRRDLEIEDRDVSRACARRLACDLAADEAAVDQLPGRPRIVPAHGLAGR